MKDILQYISLEWFSIVGVFVSVFAAFISMKILKSKKDADKRLTKLMQSNEMLKEANKTIEIIKQDIENSNNKLKELDNVNFEYKKIREEFQRRELELFKFELFKKQIELLTEKLDSKDANEVLEALNQNSMKGQTNYLNYILKKSGSSELITIDIPPKPDRLQITNK